MHLALLKARALLRLDRPDEARRVLDDASGIPCGSEESVTWRMLSGTAHVRSGDAERGLKTLIAAQNDARRTHSTIRSEISLNVALAHFALEQYDAAERALSHVTASSDIVYARALEYRGWIASSRCDAERATAMFSSALDTLDRCKHYDRFLEANCIRALAHLAVERFDRRTWAIVDERRSRMDWSASGLSHPRFWIAYCAAAYALDVDGNPLSAAREARAAEHIAPNSSCRIEAICKRSSIARYAGERFAQRDHAESAAELFEELKTAGLCGDATLMPLVLAEELAAAECPAQARLVLDIYLSHSRASMTLFISHTPATYALQRLVEGTVFESAGDRQAAINRYREALETFTRIGYTRRAVMAALRIGRLTVDRKLDAYADVATSHLAPQSWMRREIEAAKMQSVRLTSVQREVLALICQGKSNPEIARLRKRSLHTIRNLVARLFEIFEVTSREELAVQSVRRGLYTPS